MIVELKPAPEEAIDLLERVGHLEEEIKQIRYEMLTLTDNQIIQLNLIKKIEKEKESKKEPGKKTHERCKKLIQYMNNRPDHKATLDTLKGVLGVNNDKLSKTLAALDIWWPGRFEVRKIGVGDNRKKELVQMKRFK